MKPLELGTPSEIQVGADVHAIGHPTGQHWTYTRGIISQVRSDFTWKAEKHQFRANVIQTQTPINPGSSGGPLLGDSGKLLGVNSFKSRSGDSLNFAVSVNDVREFLSNASPSSPVTQSSCEAKVIYNGRAKNNLGTIVQYDFGCKGFVNFAVYTPDNIREAIQAHRDTNADRKVDVIVEDVDRDKRWDISFHDVDFDGNIDLVGFHPDGKLKASRFEKYDATRNYAAR